MFSRFCLPFNCLDSALYCFPGCVPRLTDSLVHGMHSQIFFSYTVIFFSSTLDALSACFPSPPLLFDLSPRRSAYQKRRGEGKFNFEFPFPSSPPPLLGRPPSFPLHSLGGDFGPSPKLRGRHTLGRKGPKLFFCRR